MLFLRDIDADVQLRCRACGHGGVLPRAMLERRFGPNYPVLSIAPHYRCSRCDSRDIESRPILVEPPAAANEEPSFDAPLAALQGLLASFRGTGREEDEPEPPPPARRADPSPPVALQPASPARPQPAPPARPKPVPPTKPLAELVADGPPDDDADPLWEPVSLADMAARLGNAEPPADDDAAEELDDGWDDSGSADSGKAGIAKRDQAPADDDAEDDGADETLTALHRLLAQTGWNDDPPEQGRVAGRRRSDDDFDNAPDDGWGEPDRRGSRAAAFDIEDRGDDDQDEGDEGAPAVFSHKALVRDDFEDEPETGETGDESEDWSAERWNAEDEPSDDDILSFAIRDPEKPTPRPARSEASAKSPSKPLPPQPATEPLDFDQHRAERRAQRPPPPADDEDGFDRTLAALRSMIEDAASEPLAPTAGGKPRAADRRPAPAADDSAMDDSAMDDGEPDSDPAAQSWAGPTDDRPHDPPDDRMDDHDRPASGRRSAQEREIEEAMKALRTLVEEDSPAEPPLPKPRAGKARPPEPLPERRAPEADAPPDDAKPGKPAAGHEPTPLSKTIAALRGMLELDGRRKR
ncbi:hypothetical protein [Azospirillum sp. TSO35-2]|uniref:hypothetical protein n=1 Tax=Azospirillum sp. TSO35-2 TaxID=716796 RepID=UPI0011B6F67F|nr:hypothetical protein [Azospirillum sp. TSO35-2]